MILIALTVFSCCQVSAQYANRSRFGLKATPSLSWFNPSSKDMENDGIKMDFSYGLMAEFPFNDNTAFATGFEVMNNGGKVDFEKFPDNPYYVEDEDTFNLDNREYKIRYVNLPLALKFKTNEIGYTMFYGIFGFDTGFRIKAMADDNGKFIESGDTENNNVDVSDDVNFIRLALNIGAGVEYYLAGETHLLVGVNFSNGFNNVLKNESNLLKAQDGKPFEQNSINNFIGFNIGFLF